MANKSNGKRKEPDNKIVEKLFASSSKIFDLLALIDLINSSQIQEQRKVIRDEKIEYVDDRAYWTKNLKEKIVSVWSLQETWPWRNELLAHGKPSCFKCMKFGNAQKQILSIRHLLLTMKNCCFSIGGCTPIVKLDVGAKCINKSIRLKVHQKAICREKFSNQNGDDGKLIWIILNCS